MKGDDDDGSRVVEAARDEDGERRALGPPAAPGDLPAVGGRDGREEVSSGDAHSGGKRPSEDDENPDDRTEEQLAVLDKDAESVIKNTPGDGVVEDGDPARSGEVKVKVGKNSTTMIERVIVPKDEQDDKDGLAQVMEALKTLGIEEPFGDTDIAQKLVEIEKSFRKMSVEKRVGEEKGDDKPGPLLPHGVPGRVSAYCTDTSDRMYRPDELNFFASDWMSVNPVSQQVAGKRGREEPMLMPTKGMLVHRRGGPEEHEEEADSLGLVDELFASHDLDGIVPSSDDLPDYTDEISSYLNSQFGSENKFEKSSVSEEILRGHVGNGDLGCLRDACGFELIHLLSEETARLSRRHSPPMSSLGSPDSTASDTMQSPASQGAQSPSLQATNGLSTLQPQSWSSQAVSTLASSQPDSPLAVPSPIQSQSYSSQVVPSPTQSQLLYTVYCPTLSPQAAPPPSPTQTARSPAQAVQSPAQTQEWLAKTVQSPAQTVQSPAQTQEWLAKTVQSPAQTVQSPAQTQEWLAHMVQSPAQTVQSPAQTQEWLAKTVQSPAQTVQSPAQTQEWLAKTVQSPAQTVQSPAQTQEWLAHMVQSPAQTVQSPAQTVYSVAQTVQSPVQPVNSPTQTVQSPAQTGHSPTQTVYSPVQTVHSPAHTQEWLTQPVQSPAQTVQSPAQTVQALAQTQNWLAKTVNSQPWVPEPEKDPTLDDVIDEFITPTVNNKPKVRSLNPEAFSLEEVAEILSSTMTATQPQPQQNVATHLPNQALSSSNQNVITQIPVPNHAMFSPQQNSITRLPNQATSQGQQNIVTHVQAMSPGQQNIGTRVQAMSTGQQNAVTHVQAMSPGQQNVFTYVQAMSPGQQNVSTRVQALSPGQQNAVTHVQAMSPGQQNVVTHVQAMSPGQKNVTHVQAMSPGQQNVFTRIQAVSPGQQNVVTHVQAMSPGQQNVVTHVQAMSPRQQNAVTHVQAMSPGQQNVTTHVQAMSPGQQNIVRPLPKQAMSPQQQIVTQLPYQAQISQPGFVACVPNQVPFRQQIPTLTRVPHQMASPKTNCSCGIANCDHVAIAPKPAPSTQTTIVPVQSPDQKPVAMPTVKPNQQSPACHVDKKALLVARRAIASNSLESLMAKDVDGDTSLHLVVAKRQLPLLIALLERYKRDNKLAEIINEKNRLNQTSLHLAVLTRHTKMVQILLNAGADPSVSAFTMSAIKEQEKHYMSTLHVAARRGDTSVPILQHLLSVPTTKPNQTCSHGLSALHYAAKVHGQTETMSTGDGLTRSWKIMSYKTFHLLLNAGADINQKEGKSGKTPLHFVIETGDIDFVKLALESLSSAKMREALLLQTYDGNTALHVAAGLTRIPETDHKMLIRLLMSKGADPTRRNSTKQKPADLVKSLEIRSILKQTNASRQSSTSNTTTPTVMATTAMTYAVSYG